MKGLELQAPVRWWKCPTCELTDLTRRGDVHTQFHPCPALGGIVTPLIEVPGPDERVDGRHRLVEREDYIGTSGASPIAAVLTERGDGSNDCTVLAPTATAGVGA
jgi:hypothetical protein